MNLQLIEENNQDNFKDLVKIAGSKQLAMFVIAWLKHNRNATKAYLELHPNVTYESARVLGSRMLSKVNIGDLLAIYDLGIDKYMKQLNAGLEAQRWNHLTKEREPDHRTRFSYFETLGRLLGFENEKRTLVDTNVQVNLERPIIYIPKKMNE